ncbi:MAG TPA: heme ABC exporter ATP-binding protein CcmA [Trueperaceae bacterium]
MPLNTSTAHAGTPAIRLERLGRRYGRQFVLADVSLTVAPGRLVVLHGPNGAGKTTLLKVLATRLRPSRGSGSVFGFDLVLGASEIRKRAALLGVYGGAYPALTAAENLEFAARLYGQDSREIDGLLDQVGLSPAAHTLVRTFSSGMKKRLALARLLLSPANLWLLDEPYAALDESGKGLIDALLGRARSEGKTVILASHELERVEPLADAVLQVEDGGLSVRPRGERSVTVAAVGGADV